MPSIHQDEPLDFEFSVTKNEDGKITSAYIHVTQEPVASTKEVVESVMMADYSASGALVGIELLGPVTQPMVEAVLRGDYEALRERVLKSCQESRMLVA